MTTCSVCSNDCVDVKHVKFHGTVEAPQNVRVFYRALYYCDVCNVDFCCAECSLQHYNTIHNEHSVHMRAAAPRSDKTEIV